MENNTALVGSEIHGFRTTGALDVGNMMEEAKARWLRPNEIHAILCNYKIFTVHVKPVHLPKSGTIVLFDRKMLRNFRKDGYNWKKKKDGKTVKEAHEHLKVGNVERIHVYYAHGEDNPTFVRRCYWLLDKSLEHIVLVHYRDTQEASPAPATPRSSNSTVAICEKPASGPLLEESDSMVHYKSTRSPLEHNSNMIIKDHEQKLHEINTLEWDELLMPDASNNQSIPLGGIDAMNQYMMHGYKVNEGSLATNKVSPESSVDSFSGHVIVSGRGPLAGGDSLDDLLKDTLQSQDSFGNWVDCIIADSPGSVDQALESSISTGNQSFISRMLDNHLSSALDQIFNIADVSPSWAFSTEETKILVVGCFNGRQVPVADSTLFLVCGDTIVSVEVLQDGVFRCVIPPQSPGVVNLYLSFDGHNPISQVLTFEFRATSAPAKTVCLDDKSDWEELRLQMRLGSLLFSSSQSLDVYSSKLSQSALKEAKAFAQRTSHVSKGWLYLYKLTEDVKMPFSQARDSLFELTLQNRLQEWLLEKVVSGCKLPERDEHGQGVIHLCAILGYTWAILPYSWSGLSMDYRDKFGWTALHWAAFYGREKMVAALLSAGAKPNLVTDPTSESPGGCTAADLASKSGFDGLAAYLAEKALVAQFNDMNLAGNVSRTLQSSIRNESEDPGNFGNFNEDELYLKDTLTAYRTAADAAARIQAAFRERSYKLRTKEVEASNPEAEARSIVAAMKIQHAFRNFESRKKLAAVARIQYRFRTWKMRKEFLNMRRQAIKIQAVFRGFQVRRQYTKIVWSVGIVEKAILRWRLKRRGFRGLQVQCTEPEKGPDDDSNAEEDFFRASRKQAEERVERSVVKVQAMFRSKRAQEDYRRMKLEHSKATLEYEGLSHPDADMG
ncbi:calmodulin-binding transcription activator 5-like isoform X2 [Andrographis paniculata]|uniref:calmodulin-binding transcription activator 5-like isoform X2 n=1 Tax=Andrographis paniculata TaxID=175694 RepID=UPI0021E75DB9|nr:calmodulin-binding transcription activator 5-like isoform X2 [Andrographis paniculata]